ncbi:hypothetical protein DFH08DRAFT_897523 [Mycena albidolilacea]|uniref:Uncharacterized protein n=1 Tax=Mycena albidolilacea TaxID=1033008 RepID=A0AAD6Z8Z3_9AGAR|nr:hypothetical protein DFH08DRAFT_897523 [Mycena albidolilacea]
MDGSIGFLDAFRYCLPRYGFLCASNVLSPGETVIILIRLDVSDFVIGDFRDLPHILPTGGLQTVWDEISCECVPGGERKILNGFPGVLVQVFAGFEPASDLLFAYSIVSCECPDRCGRVAIAGPAGQHDTNGLAWLGARAHDVDNRTPWGRVGVLVVDVDHRAGGFLSSIFTFEDILCNVLDRIGWRKKVGVDGRQVRVVRIQSELGRDRRVGCI